jgi:hypothetical protein
MFNSTKKSKKNKKTINPKMPDKTDIKPNDNVSIQSLTVPDKEEVTLQSLHGTLKSMFDFLISFSTRTDTRLDRIESDIVKIKSDIVRIDISIEKFHKYMKTESTVQEKRDTQYIKNLYSINHSTSVVYTLYIDNVYNRTGGRITELDGFLLVSETPLKVPSFVPNSRDIRTLYAHSLHEPQSIIPSSKMFHPPSMSYIIIESKHGLTKSKLDIKFKQFLTLKQLFMNISDTNYNKYNKHHAGMVEQLLSETNLSLSDLSQPSLFMIISSDDLSDELYRYIQAIHDGISDEKTYDVLTHSMLFSDHYLTNGLFKLITTSQRIPIKFKSIIKQRQSISTIRDMFSRANEWVHLLDTQEDIDNGDNGDDDDVMRINPVDVVRNTIQEYLLPFSTIKNDLIPLKEHIGVLRLGTVYLPTLFTIETIKGGAGWTPGATCAYDPTELNYIR